MSGMNVAQATSTEQTERVPVASRETLCSGALVDITVDVDAHLHTCDGGGIERTYLAFARGVKGGHVSCFLHTDDLAYRGQTVLVEAKLMMKTLADGRQYLYLDLFPVEQYDEVPTHRLAVMSKFGMKPLPHWRAFQTPSPLFGTVIFAPADARFGLGITPVSEMTRAPLSGDLQLDRLLADGWKIQNDEGRTVTLVKDGKKPLIHHRPAPKTKKKGRK